MYNIPYTGTLCFNFLCSLRAFDTAGRSGSYKFSAGFSSNLVFLVWAVFGGFLLHILLCNYLTVLLKPRYEEPVNSAHDLIERNITPFIDNGFRRQDGTSENYLQIYFRTAFRDPVYQKVASRLEVPTDDNNALELWERINSPDPKNRTAVLFTKNGGRKYWNNYYYSEEIVEMEPLPFEIHILNKKWPLKKVYMYIYQSIRFTSIRRNFHGK